jgi:hypothetical protein
VPSVRRNSGSWQVGRPLPNMVSGAERATDQARMLDFQPLIARLVDRLLRLVREASVEELRDLLLPAEADPAPSRRRPLRGKLRQAAKSAPRPKRRAVPHRPRALAAPVPAVEPPLHAEITDPDRLLAAAAPSAPTTASARPRTAPVATAEPSPPNGQRSVSAKLRSGESVAHASERGGVVIRRRSSA